MKKLLASSVLFLAMGIAAAQQTTPPTGTQQTDPHQSAGSGDNQAQVPNREPNAMGTQGATTTQPTSDQNQNAPGTENNAIQNTNQTPGTNSSTTASPSSTTTPDQTASPAAGSTATSNPSTTDQNAGAPTNNATTQDTGANRLPQTGSPLPLMGLLGLGSLAGGFWTARKRR